MYTHKFIVLVAVLLLIVSVESYAEKHIVEIGSDVLTSITPVDESLGNYYVLQLDIPNVLTGKEFLGAFLEFTADVSARSINEYTNDTPVLEVYALSENYNNELDPSKFETPSPMKRNIPIGNNRNVKIDIKEVVKELMSNPNNNHGLVLGSLTNTRDGLFTIKSSNGRLAIITYYYMEK
jgi:hypothetical protein